ncbi:hypothetical protein H0H93_011379 [Arthromyces matolae]|nr:hypothetical protein H0H93_011379 [Arthromyces matolae]
MLLNGLRRFEITADEIENLSPTIRVLQELPNLDTLCIPLYAASSDVLEAASRLPKLQRLIFTGRRRKQLCTCTGVSVSPVFTLGCFPSLRTLTIAGCASELSAIIGQSHFPTEIHTLQVYTMKCGITGDNVLTMFHKSLVNVCPDLAHYCVRDLDDSLSFSELRPLLSLKLCSLIVRGREPMTISSQELNELATSLPKLTLLNLNASPIKPLHDLGIKGGLPIDMLSLIAQSCPDLRKLGLFLDTSNVPTGNILDLPPFNGNLRELDVGKSPLDYDNLEAVTMYLSQILPATCQLGIDKTNDDEARWTSLSFFLPAMRKMKNLGRQLGESRRL